MSTQTYFGALPDSFSVDSDGGTNYCIQIELPPGTAKMMPSLSVGYNSGGGNGLLGVGWQLLGLSSITRVKATVGQDGFSGAINYDANDRFALDGVRLILVSGSAYNSSDAVYHTEIESWRKVVPQYASSDTSNGPQSFIVYTHDGMVLEFGGGTSGSIPVSSNASIVRSWLLTKAADRNGNYMTISYEPNAADGNCYPLQIDYTANDAASLTAQRTVKFLYQSRPDIVPQHQGGGVWQTGQLLQTVQTFVSGALVRSYGFAYATGNATGRTQLQSVTLSDAQGISFPATTFAWQDAPAGIFQQTSSAPPAGQFEGTYYAADLNGDGYVDLLNVYNNGGKVAFNAWFSDGTTFTSAGSPVTTSVPFYQGQFLVMDVDGSGAMDMVYAYSASGKVSATVFISSGSGSSWTMTPSTGNAVPSGTAYGTLYPMDVDGDGLTDLVCVTESSGKLVLSTLFSNGSTFAPSSTDQTKPTVAYYEGAQVMPLDSNGNGLLDLLYTYAEGNQTTFVLYASQGRSGFTEQTSIISSGTLQSEGVLMVSDFNGDGIDDVVQAYIINGQLAIQTVVADGRSFTVPTVQTFDVGIVGTELPVLLPMEVNGDGLPDLVCAVRSGASIVLNVFTSTGSGYSQTTSVVQPSGLTLGQGLPLMVPMDYNGDGKTDLVFVTESSNATAIATMPCVAMFPDLMASITNGLGGSYSLTYLPLTNGAVYSESGSAVTGSLEVRGVFSTRASGATFQVSNTSPARIASGAAYATRRVDFPKYVVSDYTKADGRGNSYQYQQFYTTALMDLTGRGWLGFASIASTDLTVGTTNLVTYSQVFPAAHSVLQTTLTKSVNGVPQSLLQQTTIAYNPVENAPNTGPGVYQVLQSAMTTDYYTYAPLTGGTPDCTLVKTSSNYDDFGNAQSISETGTALANPLYVFKEFQNDSTNWRIGFESSSKATADSAGETILSWQQISQYDNAMNVKESQVWHDQTARFLSTDYTYDACGNPLTITTPDYGVTTMTYEPTYLTFVQTKARPGANNITLITKGEYYASNGEMQTFTDENNVTTSQGIDGLGQVVSKTGPTPSGGTIGALSQSWGTDGTGTYIQVTTLLDWDGATTWTKQYIDGLLRSYRKVTLGADGQTLTFNDQEFDSRNNVVQQSLPYYQDATPLYYKTQYDEYKRAVSFTEPSPVDDGSTVTTLLTFSSTNEVVTTQASGTTDSVDTTFVYALCQGKQILMTRTDNTGAATSYTYDGLGRMLTVTDPKGVLSTTTYDTMGRPTSYKSQQGTAALWGSEITYDDVKDVSTFKDAKGNGIVVQNDSQGRMLTKAVTSVDVPGTETWTFVYDAATSALSQGRLSSVSSTDGSSYMFDYDAYGNQASISLSLDGLTWTVQQTYKPTGELESRTHPDTSVESHAYGPGGLLESVSLADSSTAPSTQLISFEQYTSSGKPQAINYGNGTSEQIGFTHLGQAKSMAITGGDKTALRTVLLERNALGALTTISDQLSSTQQNFTYDDVKRLATASGPVTGSYLYDPAGNLTLKDGVNYSGPGNQTTTGTQGSTTTFAASFDAAGNMSSITRDGATTPYKYDGENHLLSAGTTTFAYDYSGRRVKKQVADGPTIYYVSPYDQMALFADGSQQHSRFLCGKAGAVVSVTSVDEGTPPAYKGLAAAGTFYNHADHLGSTIRQTDATGNLSATVAYDAYGMVTSLTGSSSLPAMFTGKEWDDSTGLYYFEARYYDPGSGKFLTADDRTGGPLASRDVMNPYAYCLNDPANNVDPLGHNVWSDISNDFSKSTHAIGSAFSKVGSFTAHLVHNRVFQLTFSYIVDGALIIGGSACIALGFGFAGTTLLSAGVMGIIYDIKVTAKHQSFSWASWGEQLFIGALTGAIAGGAASGASAFSSYMAEGVTESVFSAGRAGSMFMNIAGGALGGGAGNVGGQFFTNLFAGTNLASGLGFAAVSGFVLGGAGSAIGEGATRGLSREPSIEDADEHWNSEFLKATTEPGFKRTPYLAERIEQAGVGAKFIRFLPGYAADWVGFGVSFMGTFRPKWVPTW